jgi:outer membrane protein TolC
MRLIWAVTSLILTLAMIGVAWVTRARVMQSVRDLDQSQGEVLLTSIRESLRSLPAPPPASLLDSLLDRHAAWSLFSGITAPLFHGGALRAQKRAAVDAYQATFAVYRETVLSAFQQVADVLNALGSDNQLVDAEHRALAASSASLDLQRISYDAGKSDLLQLVDAQRTYQQARLGDARAVTQRYQDVTQLAVAMGGGWWQAPDTERQEWGTGH